MKVKELRTWLADFGEKNQQHYNRYADPAQVSNNTPRVVQNHSGQDTTADETEDPFCIQTIPSNASTTPSSTTGDDLTPIPRPPTPARWSDVDGQPWMDRHPNQTNESFVPSEENGGDSSSRHSSAGTGRTVSGRSTSFRAPVTPPKYSVSSLRPTRKVHDGSNEKVGIDHRIPVYKHPTVSTDATEIELQLESPNVTRRRDVKMAPSFKPNGDLMKDRMLTKATLDAISLDKDNDRGSDGNEESSNSIHTTDHSSEIDSLKSFFSHESEGNSIAHGVLVSKMAAVLLNDTKGTQNLKKFSTASASASSKRGVVTTKIVDPKDLPFLQPQFKATKEPVLAPPKAPTTAVGKGIRKFDPPPKSIVAARKEELNQKFAESKPVNHVKKIKWGISSKTGGYQKKVVIHKEEK